MKTDIEIAQAARPLPIGEIAATLGLSEDGIIPYGRYIAKLPLASAAAENPASGALVLVTAMTPTPLGEGKTTNTIGLGQALAKLGKRVTIAIREPSLGPCLGMKGGAAGGGYSQVLPMEDINLHFTGDMHAVTTAHNLLASLADNHLHQKLEPALDARGIVWKRVLDMNDRALRSILVGLDGRGTNGVLREDGFEITAASEVMAVLCLADGPQDLKERLGRIIVGYDGMRRPICAADLGAPGAMAALLKHAMYPNLVQTIEGVPVLVHGGPFANIAHGCNSLIATRMALGLADYTVTEAGFGSDLGAEKFFDIKCRAGGLLPAAAVLVVTQRAVLRHGIANVARHVENLRRFGPPVLISINRFADDSEEDLGEITRLCGDYGFPAFVTDFRESGGAGGLALAEAVVAACRMPGEFRPLYPLDTTLVEKITTIATRIYGADGISCTAEGEKALQQLEDLGFGGLPVCIAKTPLSLSDDPQRSGVPRDFRITVSGARVSAGAGFVVVYTGKVMTMPGLPRRPAALDIDIDGQGNISGLF